MRKLLGARLRGSQQRYHKLLKKRDENVRKYKVMPQWMALKFHKDIAEELGRQQEISFLLSEFRAKQAEEAKATEDRQSVAEAYDLMNHHPEQW